MLSVSLIGCTNEALKKIAQVSVKKHNFKCFKEVKIIEKRPDSPYSIFPIGFHVYYKVVHSIVSRLLFLYRCG